MHMGDDSKGLLTLLRERAQTPPEKQMFGSGSWLSTAEVLSLTERAAAFIRRQGLCEGIYAALSCVGSAETDIVLLALRAAGAAVVLLDPRQTIDDAMASRKC